MMTDEIKAERLSEFALRIVQKSAQSGMTVGELLDEFQEREHMLLCVVFASPFLLPIPLPGLSTIFGAVIFLAAVQVTFGLDPWVPAKWREKHLSAKLIERIFTSLKKFLSLFETIVKPRFVTLAKHPFAIRANGGVLVILSILLALPMPPGFNAPPALAIIALALGDLEEDGILVVLGWILSLMNIALFTGFFVLGYEGLMALTRWRLA